jgi:hypothetical protein
MNGVEFEVLEIENLGFTVPDGIPSISAASLPNGPIDMSLR